MPKLRDSSPPMSRRVSETDESGRAGGVVDERLLVAPLVVVQRMLTPKKCASSVGAPLHEAGVRGVRGVGVALVDAAEVGAQPDRSEVQLGLGLVGVALADAWPSPASCRARRRR